MKVQLILDSQVAAEIDLNEGERVIGSAPPSIILLEDPSVSPTHAKIYQENGKAFIIDMGSQSGTFVEGIRINAPVALRNGVSVRLGDFDFQLNIVADAQPPVDTTAPESAHTPPMPPVESPDGAKQASSARGLGKGLMDLAKASAREAGRGAHLAGLKAQHEKIKRVDLPAALSSLGSKSFELRVLPDICGSLYEEIAAIDEAIKTKCAGVVAGQDAGFAEKAKAMAVSLKQKTEAEALGMKRKNKCVEVGKLVVAHNPANEALAPLIHVVIDIQRRLDELDKQFGAVADDRSGREAFMSSARGLGADAGIAARAPIWKKPLGWAIIGLSILTLLLGFGIFLSSGQGNGFKVALGMSETELIRNAGSPSNVSPNPVGGGRSLHYYPKKAATFDDGVLTITVTTQEGNVHEITYLKANPFSQKYIRKLLDANAEGSRWRQPRQEEQLALDRRLQRMGGRFMDASIRADGFGLVIISEHLADARFMCQIFGGPLAQQVMIEFGIGPN